MAKQLIPLTEIYQRLVAPQNTGNYLLSSEDFLRLQHFWEAGEYTRQGYAKLRKSALPSNVFVVDAKLKFTVVNEDLSDNFGFAFRIYEDSFSNTIYRDDAITLNKLVGAREHDATGKIRDFIQSSRNQADIYFNINLASAYYSLRFDDIRFDIDYDHLPSAISPNGGENMTGVVAVTWEHDTEFTGLRYDIEFSPDNGASWGVVATSATDARSHNIDFSALQETSMGRLRVRAVYPNTKGYYKESQGVFTVSHNIPPIMPVNLVPSGIIIDRTKTNRFSWKHNDSPNDIQTRADIQWRLQGSAVWTDITVNGSDQFYFITQNTLPAGQIEWRVRTVDGSGLVSPWSNVAAFSAAEPTNIPTILQPVATVPVSRPVIEWTSATQSSYQVLVEDTLGATVWDTGEIVSGIRARTVGVDLLNGGTYKVKVRVKDGNGLFSSFAETSFNVSYTPPAKPILTIGNGGHYLSVDIENPEPTGTQPGISGNAVYKRVAGEADWMRIADGIPSNTSYEDYAVASGKVYEYKVVASGENGTTRESDVFGGSVKFMGVYLHSVQDPAMTSHRYQFDGSGRSSSKQAEHAFRRFAGRKKQVVEFGEMVDYAVSASIQLLREGEGAERLEQFVENMETICYRDGRGRLLFGVITAAPLEDVSYGWETTIDVTEIDYSEEV